MTGGYLIDTHVWLWYGLQNPRLKEPARDAIERAVKTGGLAVSIMSPWEISLLESKGQITLGMSAEEWLVDALKLPNLVVLPLELPIILDAHRLPGNFQADPADRLIVATARHQRLTLITEDQKILDYARRGHLRAHATGDKELLSA